MKALKPFSKIVVTSLCACTMILAGCQGKTSSNSSESNSPSESSYISDDKANIVVPENTVTKTKLVTYPGPSIMSTSSKVGIKVDDNDLFVYETRVNHRRSFTYDYSTDTAPVAIFDFEGKVHVKIDIKDETSISSVKVSPLVYDVQPTWSGNTIEFDLTTPTNYVVEYNDDYKTAIHLFASTLEVDPITEEEAAKDDNILYFGPGVYKADSLPVHSNETIYLAGGAYIYGQIVASDLENITIRGRGIFDGEIYDRRTSSEKEIPIELQRSKNITIDGISILDPAGWAVAMIDSSDININNLKIISARANGDGISLQSCSDVTVKGGFVRSWDDSLVVKDINRDSTSNITFDGVSVWTDLAQSMEVGYETNGPTMDNITFKNITVIHNFHKACMSIHNCDDATITGVHFENITVEDGAMLGDDQDDGLNDFLIDMTIAYNIEWTKSAGNRGKVKDVTFKNIKVNNLADTILCRMEGESDESSIDGVTLDNIQIEGKQINNADDLKLTTNQYAKNIRFTNSGETCGAIITLPYKNESDGSNPTVINNDGVEQKGITVPEILEQKDNLAYIGEKNDINGATISVTHGVGTTNKAEYDDGTGAYNATDAKNIIDGDRSTLLTLKDFTGVENEFMAITITFSELTTVGVLRILGDYDNDIYNRYNISLYARKMKSDGVTENPNFVRLLSAADYEITPSKGNYCDVNFTPTQYLAIQLRIFRKDNLGYPSTISFGELEFYQPSLTYNKPIVYSTEHYDVYNVERLVDGNPDGTSYYESSTLPATIVIDMKAVYTLNCIVMFLPNLMSWNARTENIEIQISDSTNDYSDTTSFTTLVKASDYTFDPSTGNMNKIDVSSQNAKARFIKIIITSNSASGNYGAQLSEFNVYGK